jgi:exosortase
MAMTAFTPTPALPAQQWPAARRERLPWPLIVVLVGTAALVIPTLLSLAREYWSTDNGVHGPLLLATGAWLVWRSRGVIRLRPLPRPLGKLLPALAVLLPLYVYGRAMGVLTAETVALYLLLLALAFHYWGGGVLRQIWFPVLYLAFLVRPPASLVAELTQPLKLWISDAAVILLRAADYPVARSGVRIQAAQYELLVQQACAGLGSIFSLLAIGLLYLHLASAARGWKSVVLLGAIIPLAIIANLLRVILLILVTIHAGDAALRGLPHEIAGMLTFTLSLLGLFLLDRLIAGDGRRRERLG